ncbi:MAG: transglycosylase domain-containing protein [Clostridia bacterium]|nr:transglycosylase domain-containing protein [Clostridia bacterium]
MDNIHKRKNQNNRIRKSTDNIRFGKRVYEDEDVDEIVPKTKTRQQKESSSKKEKSVLTGRKKGKAKLTEEQKAKKKKRFKIKLIIVLVVLIILLIMFLVSLYKWNRIMKDIMCCQNSVVLDSTGNVIAVLGESRIQQTVTLDKVPKNLVNAYVSIEDKNFYKHHGINVKRTAGAIGSYIFHRGSSSYGGSTITQQLVKNVTGENESSISRKMVEWDRAVKTEMVMSKDEIMQTYLNVIYVGPNVYGVEMGSRYYFNKSVSDLDLAECAFLAGLNHSPNSYNPFGEKDNSDRIKSRSKLVLKVMLEENYISNEEYENAVKEIDEGLKFKKGDVKPKGDNVYSYMVDATISEAISDLQKSKKMSASFATNYLYYSGLKIYSTQNSDIQKSVESEFEKSRYRVKSEKNNNATSQAAMVVIDHNTGQVMGCAGGLGKKTQSRGFNRATQALRQTGSAIKPIAVLGPALEEKIITPLTVYDDTRTTFSSGYNPIDCERELGNITVRRAVESSQNIPFVKMMEQLTPKKAIKYMESEGITSLTDADCDLPLALGGLQKGTSPLEMAGAYVTIANGGKYIEPIFYTKIENNRGKVVLKNKQKSKKVYSEDTAYVLKELLTQPVKGENGTAKSCKIDGFEVAAKTGTTNDNYDKWLCGFTKYYTAVTWFGFDSNETIKEGADSMANQIWVNVMRNVHENLIKADFDRPKNVEEVVVCKDSGKRASGGCKNTYVEYFRKGTVPSEKCDKH